MIMAMAVDSLVSQVPGKKALAVESFSKALRQVHATVQCRDFIAI